jgi:sugar phosphate isomerase/epimerase
VTPRFSIIDATTPTLSFEEAVNVYRRAGADAIGTSEARIADVPASVRHLRASGLELTGCFLETDSILPAADGDASPAAGVARPDLATPETRLASIAASMRRLARLEPRYFYVLTGPRGRYDVETARSIVVDGLRELSAVAAELGTAIVLEVFHATLESWSFVHTVPDAVSLLDRVDRPNVALACDVWHLGLDPEILGDLRRNATRLASLHVDDRRDPTRSVWDRLLPGDGVADLPGILGSLAAGGFDGWYELEILSDDGSVEQEFPDSLWKRDPIELVSAGRAQFLAAWAARRGDD